MFSIVIPLYNKSNRVKTAIDSALLQDYEGDWEIIVVDDGSTDDSASFVKEYSDKKVRYFFQKNGGVSSARNRGIKEAIGEWLVFLDADDELFPCALSMFDGLVKHSPQSSFLVGASVWKSNGCIVTKGANTGTIRTTTSPHYSLWLNSFYAAPRNFAVHRKLIEIAGGFDERMSFYEDTEFVYRLLRYSNVVYTDKNMSIYHQDGLGLSASKHPMEKEFAYYIPECISKAGFWEKVLLYENIELTKLGWADNQEVTAMYVDMQRKHFSWIYPKVHWLRQQLIRHGIL